MIPFGFDYEAPTSLDKAMRLLSERPDDGVGFRLETVGKHAKLSFLFSRKVEFQRIVQVEYLRKHIRNRTCEALAEVIGCQSCPGASTKPAIHLLTGRIDHEL